ncbi:MAG: hypothetical protein GY870_16530 [archaeon]|nr:hypothetical protein [archaeon]
MIINISEDKEKQCYNKDKRYHNSYGPDETECDGYKTYYINGYCHNPYGPAIIHSTGKMKYWLNGVEYFRKRWEQLRHGY